MTVRVLIVEDEKLIRWSLRQKFEARGYHVTDFENGTEALQSLDANVYDLIMLDYKLPDMTGLDILRSVRERDVDVVAIMMTAFSSIDSAGSKSVGRISYSTSISSSAFSAICSLSAATNATLSPTKRTLLSREKVSNGPGIGSD